MPPSAADRWIPFWLLLLPALAVIGGVLTLWLVLKYPDQELSVEHVSHVTDANGDHQHVVNSVTPPLK